MIAAEVDSRDLMRALAGKVRAICAVTVERRTVPRALSAILARAHSPRPS